jgi:hypothetical protein
MREVGLVLASGLVVWGALGVACRLRLGRRVDVLLAAATLATLQVVVTVLFAGLVIGRLSPWVLLGCTVVVSGPLVWLFRADRVVTGWVGAVRGVRVGGLWRVVRAHLWASILGLGAVGQVLWRAVISYAVPPYGWDALWYHLTTVATWVTAGQITFVPYGLWSNIFPANGEVVTTWVATFTHSSVGLTGIQLPFGVLGALAVMSLARTVGVSRSGAVAAGSLFFLTPIVLAQTTSNYVDLTGAALVLVTLAFGLRFVAVGRDDSGLGWRLALLCGIAGGLAIGTKTTSIAYVGLIGVVVAVIALRTRQEVSHRLWTLGAFVGPAVILGGFWFVRIWVHYGNPVYPFAVNIGPVHLFDGPARASEFVETAPTQLGGSVLIQPLRAWWHDVVYWHADQYIYDQRNGGFGAVWLLLDVPVGAVLTWIAVRRRNVLYLLLVFIPVLGFAVEPYRWWTRFSIPLLAPGVIALPLAIEQLSRQVTRRVLTWLSTGLVALTAVLASVHLVTETGNTLQLHDIVHRALHPSLAADDGRNFMPADAWLDTLGRNQLIAVERHPYDEEFYFPVFGGRLSHRLLPIDPTDPAALIHDLQTSRVSVVVALVGSNIDRWAAADTRHFTLLGQTLPASDIGAHTFGRAYRFST